MGTNNIDTFVGAFSFYEQIADRPGMILLWSVETCEDCGCETEAPNSAQIVGRGLGHILERNKLTKRALNVGELGYSETFGGAVCPECWEKHDG